MFLELRLIIINVVFWLCVCIVALDHSIDAQLSRSFDLSLLSFSEVVFSFVISVFISRIPSDRLQI